MNPRLTPLAFAFAALCGWAFFLAIVTSRLELVLAAIPMLVVLASCGQAANPETVEVSRKTSKSDLHQGEELTFSVTLSSKSDFAALAIFEPSPDRLELISDAGHRMLSLDGSRSVSWERRFLGRARGKVELGDIHLRAWDRSGLTVVEARSRQTVAVRIYPAVEYLPVLPAPPRTQLFFGDHASRMFGEGIEAAELKPFTPGDRMRRVNWPASLRRQQLFVNRYNEERSADIVLLIDSLSEIGRSGSTSLDHTVRAAASVGVSYLARRDRVGSIEYGGFLRWLRPAAGRRQAARLLDSLLPAEVYFTYLGKDLGMLPRQVLPSQALVIAISPLADPRFFQALEDLAARKFDLLVINVSPIPLVAACVADSPVARLALRIWALERKVLSDRLTRRGVSVVDWSPSLPLSPVVARAMHRRGLRIPS